MTILVDQQLHGYKNGHQLLSSSLTLSRPDQDEIDKLSDIAGSLRPGERFSPYLTFYPLPSKEFYVAARTWQDLDAPRAGCVTTRSFVFPMEAWMRLRSLAFLQTSFAPLVPTERALKKEISVEAGAIPPVQEGRAIELVEALFLENRKPTVCFDVNDSEAISLRLLTAMWPNLRSNFCCCTFTLAPRSVGNRDFDLLFAPKTAKSRFVDWAGRKVDLDIQKPPRHRWSVEIAARIFNSDVPDLETSDALGLLSRPELASEASLRLSLLWNELSEKASYDPTAVLGMLDIVNSQKEVGPSALHRLSAIIIDAATMADRSLDSEQTWSFLSTLIGKFPKKLPPTSVLRDLECLARNLTRRDPDAAVKYMEDATVAVRLPPYILLAAIGDALAYDRQLRLSRILQGVSQHIILALAALSEKFLRILIEERGSGSLQQSFLKGCLSFPDKMLQRRVLRSLSKYLDADFGDLLAPLLQPLSASEFISAIHRIGRHTSFKFRNLDSTILYYAKHLGALSQIRRVAQAYYESEGAKRFLINSLSLSNDDLSWVAENCDSKSASEIAAALIVNATEQEVRSAISERNNSELISNLLSNVGSHPEEYAKLLASGFSCSTLSVAEIDKIVEAAGSNTREKLAEAVVSFALTDPHREYGWAAEMLKKLGGQVTTNQIVQHAVSLQINTDKFGENIQLLNDAPTHIRRQILREIEKISEAVIRRGYQNLGSGTYDAWADLISDAGKLNPDAQFRAAIAAFGFALRQLRFPVSSIVVATFPLVYQKIPKSKKASAYNPVLALIEITLSFFGEVDRPAAVRQELIDAFIHSNWRASDLLLAGIAAGVDQKILKELSQRYGGRGYLDRIVEDVADLSNTQRKRADRSLERFFN